MKKKLLRNTFSSDYSMLRSIDMQETITSQLKDNSGRNRYYSDVHWPFIKNELSVANRRWEETILAKT